MYGLPKDTDLAPLHGKELIQLCIGAYQFQLHFSDGKSKDATICVECMCELQTDDGSTRRFVADTPEQLAQEASLLAQLIGKSVVKAEVVSPGTLRLHFSNKWSIDIIDDSPDYEAYQIHFSRKSIFGLKHKWIIV